MVQFQRQAEALMKRYGLAIIAIRKNKHIVYTVERNGERSNVIVSQSPKSPEQALKNMQRDFNRRFAHGKV